MLNLAGYTLTFDDEFNGLSISQNGTGTVWSDIRPGSRIGPNTDIGFGDSAFVDAGSGVNPFSLQNGALQITAVPNNDPSVVGGAQWASGLIDTLGSFSQEYGYFEMRAELPTGTGVWPAFWMLPVDQTQPAGLPPPELDVLEAYGDTNLYQTVHTDETGTPTYQMVQSSQTTITSGYHTYGVMWGPQYITFYFDGQETGQLNTPADMNQPMYLLADLAMQDLAGVTDTSKQLEIDYIRVFSDAPNAVAVPLSQISSPDGVDTSSLYGATAANSPVSTPSTPPVSTGNLIQNGDFVPNVSVSDVMTLETGSTAMAGWTVTAGSVDNIRPTYWQSPDGGYTLQLNGTGAGTIAQTIATTVGTQYDVSFELSGNPGDPTTEIHSLEVAAAGQSQDYSFDSTGYTRTIMGWQAETFVFTANSTSTTLQFTSLDQGGWGAAIGEVSVSAAGTTPTTPTTITPETFLTGTPAAQTTSDDATFTFTGDDPGGSGVALFQASLDGAPYTTAVSGITYTNLADGSHTFSVRDVDADGNVDPTPATFDWTITAPTTPTQPTTPSTPPVSTGNLIENGDFVPTDNICDVMTLDTGSTAMPGWTVTAGSVDDIRPTYWQSPDGGFTVQLNGTDAGTLAQTIATTVGVQYDVSFELAGNPGDPTTEIHSLEVAAAGQSQDYSFDSTGYTRTIMGWQAETFVFTANSTSTTLQFTSLDQGGWGAAIGEVSVTPQVIGSTTIAAGATTEIPSAFSGAITFAGSTGTLQLDNSSSFSGTVAGLAGQDTLDLRDINPATVQTPTYSGSSTGGILTVTDGTNTAKISLLGNYLASSFVTSSDGNGGTAVIDPLLISSNPQIFTSQPQHA
jgi:choice-of-anchor C domain-containing protein